MNLCVFSLYVYGKLWCIYKFDRFVPHSTPFIHSPHQTQILLLPRIRCDRVDPTRTSDHPLQTAHAASSRRNKMSPDTDSGRASRRWRPLYPQPEPGPMCVPVLVMRRHIHCTNDFGHTRERIRPLSHAGRSVHLKSIHIRIHLVSTLRCKNSQLRVRTSPADTSRTVPTARQDDRLECIWRRSHTVFRHTTLP